MKNKLFKVCLFLIVLSTLFSCFACNNNAHTHNFSFVKYNKTEHWLECSCKEKKDVVKHVIEKGKCKYCSWGASAFKVSDEERRSIAIVRNMSFDGPIKLKMSPNKVRLMEFE